MTPWLDDGDVRLYHGDVINVLRQLAPSSVQTCVTSPPYWGLRDYGKAGQIGLEATPGEYVARMVEVFREVRRVLRDDGTLWLNLGDSYAGPRGNTRGDGAGGGQHRGAVMFGAAMSIQATPDGLKPKDLVGIPWRVAFALQDDGWYLRADVIWAKPNPMPESVTDRPTKAHEYVFLLTKSPRYFYDHEAIREPISANWKAGAAPPMPLNGSHVLTSGRRGNHAKRIYEVAKGANARSVWTITTKPYAGAHFATFPVELPERCVKAGTPEAGCCAKCGAPRERVIVATAPDGRRAEMRGGKAYDDEGRPLMGDNMIDHGTRGSWNSGGKTLTRETTGFRASCECNAETVPSVVLDPFSGSGTTAWVARHHGRHAVGIELNEDYLRLSADRLRQLSLLGDAVTGQD